MLVYKFMLEHMPDDQRFQMSHKLCQDILGEGGMGKGDSRALMGRAGRVRELN